MSRVYKTSRTTEYENIKWNVFQQYFEHGQRKLLSYKSTDRAFTPQVLDIQYLGEPKTRRQLLASFIKIKDVQAAEDWAGKYGLPFDDLKVSWETIVSTAKSMEWLHCLQSLMAQRKYDDLAKLLDYMVCDRKRLLQADRDREAYFYDLWNNSGQPEAKLSEVVVTKELIEGFETGEVLVYQGYVYQTFAQSGSPVPITKDPENDSPCPIVIKWDHAAWKILMRKPEHIMLIAKEYLMQALSHTLKGITPTFYYRYDSGAQDYYLSPGLCAHTPWEAMNIALYEMVYNASSLRTCAGCSEMFLAERPNHGTCSLRCRQRRSRKSRKN